MLIFGLIFSLLRFMFFLHLLKAGCSRSAQGWWKHHQCSSANFSHASDTSRLCRQVCVSCCVGQKLHVENLEVGQMKSCNLVNTCVHVCTMYGAGWQWLLEYSTDSVAQSLHVDVGLRIRGPYETRWEVISQPKCSGIICCIRRTSLYLRTGVLVQLSGIFFRIPLVSWATSVPHVAQFAQCWLPALNIDLARLEITYRTKKIFIESKKLSKVMCGPQTLAKLCSMLVSRDVTYGLTFRDTTSRPACREFNKFMRWGNATEPLPDRNSQQEDHNALMQTVSSEV